MALTLNTNLSGLNAGHQLNRTGNSLADSLNRIASAKKINSAADDASGMTIARRLNSQALGLGQAARNASDGISMTQIAEGALGQMSEMIQTIRTKAVEAASDSQSQESRQAIQAEINSLLSALDDVAGQTSFNGQSLLSGSFTNRQFAVGADAGETVTVSIDSAATSVLGSSDSGFLSGVDVTTAEGAAQAIEIADQALDQISGMRSDLGATQNRFETSIYNLTTTATNLTAAESQIMDTDLAEESINLNRLKMLEKTGAYALAQANTSREKVINLIQ